MRLDAIVGFRFESGDFALAVHHQTERYGLYASGGKPFLDFAPEDGGEFEPHQTVQRAPGLLRVHKVIVDVPRMLYGFQDGIFGDFVENDAAGTSFFQSQDFRQVPGNGLPLPVLIGRQPYGLCRGSRLAQF